MITLFGDVSYWGEGILAAIFLLCSFAAVFGLAALKLDAVSASQKILSCVRAAVSAVSILSVIAFLLFINAFVRDDFSIAAVAGYSSLELPFFYKLSAVWAGPAGSLLLWSVCVFVMFGLWAANSGTKDIRFDAARLSAGAFICLGFSALLVFAEKPFAGSLVTLDNGSGLNPLLRNFWMIIHPPLLFLGYSALSFPFVIIIAGIFAGKMAEAYVYKQLRFWLLLGICFLGLGIATGARWSYIVLGWGGYWAWDPVENVSLLPWLIAVASLHSLVGINADEKFKLWTAVLAPVPFILCLVATFVTRSGILQSVHSFGQSAVSGLLLTFIVCGVLLWLICAVKAKKAVAVKWSSPSPFHLNRSEILFWVNVVLVFTTIIIGVATFWPIILQFVTTPDLNFMLTRTFYDKVISAVGVLLAFLLGLGALADSQKRISLLLRVLSCLAAGVICFGFILNHEGKSLLISLACGICAFSFVAVLTGVRLTDTISRTNSAMVHLGVLLLVFAAGYSSAEQSIQTVLTKGGRILLGKYELVYDSFEHKTFNEMTQMGPRIAVTSKNISLSLWPHSNLYADDQSISEVAVYTGLFKDIYVAFDGAAKDGRVVITAKVKPMMLWFWIAILWVGIGPVLGLFEDKRIEDAS
jgi:cytochrome c-type biogenesis protein CcmF